MSRAAKRICGEIKVQHGSTSTKLKTFTAALRHLQIRMIQVVQQSNRPSSTLGFCFHCKASSVQPGKLASGGKWWQVVASVTGFSTTRKAATFRSACSGATKLFFPSATAQEPSHVGAIMANNDSTSRNTENAMCSKTVPLVPLYLHV